MGRIDECWQGAEIVGYAEIGVVTVPITLPLAAWLAPTEVVYSRLSVALSAALAPETVTVSRAVDGSTDIVASDTLTLTLIPGWAEWAGFASTSYAGSSSYTSEASAPHWFEGYLGHGLPIRYYSRQIHADRLPVVWAEFWAVEVQQWTDEPGEFPPPRVPVALSWGDTDPWEPDNLDGYLVLRPLLRDWRRVPAQSQTYGLARYDWRGEWLDPTL